MDTLLSNPTTTRETSSTIIPSEFSPYLKFTYALNAPESKRQYPKRFQIFLDYLDIKGETIEEKANKLYYDHIAIKGKDWLETELLKFFIIQNDRAERNEISTETIRNYYKPVKLFCDMNGILINWKFISKGIKKGQRHSDDRPPSIEEIKKLLEYPDRRIKLIVLVMISSGIRVSSWEYLKWKDFTPLQKNGEIVAAKMNVFNAKTHRYYYTFCTFEAYSAVKEWMDFRASFGEKITGESDILRDLWQIKTQRYANYLGLAKHPKKFGYHGIRMLINDAWKIQGVREELKEGKRRYEFKSLHGFRKFFESECQKVMKTINVSYLMSHDTGIVQHYYKPKMEELLDNYMLAVDLLTISDANKLSKKILELKEQNQDKDYMIKGKLQDVLEQNKVLTSKIQEYEDIQKEGRIMSKEHAQKFADIYDKINELMDQRKEERKRSRDYEMATDFIDRDTKFDILSITSERTAQKQNELEITLEKTLLKEQEQNK